MVSLMGVAVASSLIIGQLKKALPRSMKSALIPAGLVAVSPHYANYVTGLHFKAILFHGMYTASCDNEQFSRPLFVRSRPLANPQHNSNP